MTAENSAEQLNSSNSANGGYVIIGDDGEVQPGTLAELLGASSPQGGLDVEGGTHAEVLSYEDFLRLDSQSPETQIELPVSLESFEQKKKDYTELRKSKAIKYSLVNLAGIFIGQTIGAGILTGVSTPEFPDIISGGLFSIAFYQAVLAIGSDECENANWREVGEICLRNSIVMSSFYISAISENKQHDSLLTFVTYLYHILVLPLHSMAKRNLWFSRQYRKRDQASKLVGPISTEDLELLDDNTHDEQPEDTDLSGIPGAYNSNAMLK